MEYRDHSAHARLDSLERSVGQLADSMATFAEKTERHLLNVTDKISASQKTDWGVLLAVGGLIFTALGGGAMLITRQTESLGLVLAERDKQQQAAIASVEDRVDRHNALPGHYEAMQRHAKTDARLDEVFRRLDDLERRDR